MQLSLLDGGRHDQWLQQGHQGQTMDKEARMACEVLRSMKAGKVSHDHFHISARQPWAFATANALTNR